MAPGKEAQDAAPSYRAFISYSHVDTAFDELTFDHQRHSRFALDARHRRVPCAGCHRTVQTEFGPAVRYKPLGTECKDCHRAIRDWEVRR